MLADYSYKIICQVGKGGMGVVYKAKHTVNKNFFALKKLTYITPKGIELFKKEAKNLAKLDHRNIVKFKQYFVAKDELYIVMEFVEGESLFNYMNGQPISQDIAVGLFEQILQGVAYAHQKNIVHRDIKPANIMVTLDDTIKITDFGIAKEVGVDPNTGTSIMGTPAYMAPELFNILYLKNNDSVDYFRCDIYSLGVTFYEMLLGYPPDRNGGVIRTPIPVNIKESIRNAVLKALQNDPEKRFNDIGEFISALHPKSNPKFKNPANSILALGNELSLPGIGKTMFLVKRGALPLAGNLNKMMEPFLIAKTPVTQILWKSIIGDYHFPFEGDNKPVERVSWYDAIEFCNRLSEKEGYTKCYSEVLVPDKGLVTHCDFAANGYRLPTEKEWEYAARGGGMSNSCMYSGNNVLGEVGWFFENSNGQPHDVGTKQPNEIGIYDMSGNVWEWCWNVDSGFFRVIRGGSFCSDATECTVKFRSKFYPGNRSKFIGFRLVRTFNC